MNANLENCKKLYGLSGWRDTAFLFTSKANGELWVPSYHTYIVDIKSKIPAYDLGYLLKKLPAIKPNTKSYLGIKAYGGAWADGGWIAAYGNSDQTVHADTPEDALCLLAIKLFEEKVL